MSPLVYTSLTTKSTKFTVESPIFSLNNYQESYKTYNHSKTISFFSSLLDANSEKWHKFLQTHFSLYSHFSVPIKISLQVIQNQRIKFSARTSDLWQTELNWETQKSNHQSLLWLRTDVWCVWCLCWSGENCCDPVQQKGWEDWV